MRRHSLRRLCGLKSIHRTKVLNEHTSQPAKAVWIEIHLDFLQDSPYNVTACEGCVD